MLLSRRGRPYYLWPLKEAAAAPTRVPGGMLISSSRAEVRGKGRSFLPGMLRIPVRLPQGIMVSRSDVPVHGGVTYLPYIIREITIRRVLGIMVSSARLVYHPGSVVFLGSKRDIPTVRYISGIQVSSIQSIPRPGSSRFLNARREIAIIPGIVVPIIGRDGVHSTIFGGQIITGGY